MSPLQELCSQSPGSSGRSRPLFLLHALGIFLPSRASWTFICYFPGLPPLVDLFQTSTQDNLNCHKLPFEAVFGLQWCAKQTLLSVSLQKDLNTFFLFPQPSQVHKQPLIGLIQHISRHSLSSGLVLQMRMTPLANTASFPCVNTDQRYLFDAPFASDRACVLFCW